MNVNDIPIVALLLRNDPKAVKPVVPVIPPVFIPQWEQGPGIDNASEESAMEDFLLSELADSVAPFENDEAQNFNH